MEIVGVVGAATGLAISALQVVGALQDLISSIKSAPRSVTCIAEELKVLKLILSSVDTTTANEGLKSALRECLDELTEMQQRVGPWTEKARGAGPGLGMTAFLMHREEKELREVLKRLERRKMTLCVALIIGCGGGGGGAEAQVVEMKRLMAETLEEGVRRALVVLGERPAEELGVLRMLDRSAAVELWKMDLPSLRKVKEAVLRRRREIVMKIICSVDYRDDYAEITPAAETTCEWIWKEKHYQTWRQSKSSGILHVVGKPGQGKTVLAKYVLRQFKQDSEAKRSRYRALYYFCNSRKHSQETASAVLRAIIHQLLEDIPALIEQFFESSGTGMESHPFSTAVSDDGWSLEVLCRTLLDMVAASKLEEVFCVIDALDENDQESVGEFLEMLVKGLESSDSRTKLKVFITSRPEEYIIQGLEYHPQIRIAPQTIERDISAWVCERLIKLNKKKRLGFSEQQMHNLQTELVDRAEGLFLWASLVLNVIEKAKGLTRGKLETLVRRMPSGLSELYDKILSKIHDEMGHDEDYEQVRRILTWVVLAARPLTLAELRVALALRLGGRSLDGTNIMYNIRDVQTICGAFLEIVPAQGSVRQPSGSVAEGEEGLGDTVRLIHQSAKDYLLDAQFKLAEPLSKFRIDPQAGNLEIALHCLTYLMFDAFDGGPESKYREYNAIAAFADGGDGSYETMTMQALLKQHPLLEYASTCWTLHTRQASSSEGKDLYRLACEFLYSPHHFENCLRVRSLLKHPGCHYTGGLSPLNSAASWGLYYVVEEILKNSEIDINKADDLGETALSAVLINSGSGLGDTLRIVRLLVDRGAELRLCQCHGHSPLHHVIVNSGPLELCESLVDMGAASEGFDLGLLGRRSFHYAAIFNRKDLVELLLSRNINHIDVTTHNGETALHMACHHGALDTVRFLVSRGASIRAVTNDNHFTPLHMAVTHNQRDVVGFLLREGAQLEARALGVLNTPLHFATRAKNLETMGLLLKFGADVNAITDGVAHTPLHIAVQHQDFDSVKFLLDHGANIEAYALGHLEATPLIYAIEECGRSKGAVGVLRLLLDRGANVEALWGRNASRALHAVIMYMYQGIVPLNMILEKVLEIDSVSRHGHTALHMACNYDDAASAQVLINAGASMTARDKDGDTPLMLAVRSNAGKAVSLLLKCGVDPEIPNNYGETALMCAAEEGYLGIVKALLKGGAKVDPKKLGESMLAIAAASGNARAVREHLKMANSNSAVRMYWNILQDRGVWEQPQSIDTILLAASLPELTSSRGSTLLHWACLAGDSYLVEQLLGRGMDPMLVDQNGWMPWNIANRRGFTNIQELLERVNARPLNGSPSTRTPTRWINIDFNNSPPGFRLNDDGLAAELPDGFKKNKDKSPAVIGDVCVPDRLTSGGNIFYYEIQILNFGSLELFDVGFSLEIVRLSRHLGYDSYGWSYSACNGMKRHKDIWSQYGGHIKCARGDIIGCGLNLSTATVFFTRNGVFLGDAFTDVSGPLYPHLATPSSGFEFNSNFGVAPFAYVPSSTDEGVDMEEGDSSQGE